jgi:hypothetical protein
MRGSGNGSRRLVRRPFGALSAVGTAAHHAFEVAAGVGLVFEPWLGRRGATAYWSAFLPGFLLIAARGSTRWDGAIAFNAGASLAGALVHYALWPWSLRKGVPVLDEAEGMTEDQLPAYNAILVGWALASALALAREVPPSKRRWAAAGLCMGEPFRRSARHHFEWAREQAKLHPDEWSAALRD